MSDSKVYRVREGVEWVNGARVPQDRRVRLTEAEARFDLEQGRIEPDATILDDVVGGFADLGNEVAAVDAAVNRTEHSIKQGARRGKRRFRLSEDDDGRD